MAGRLRIYANKISHKGTKTQRGIGATDFAKAMSVKKERRERKKKGEQKTHAKTPRKDSSTADKCRYQSRYEPRRPVLVQKKVQSSGLRLNVIGLVGRPGGRLTAE
jgi:hypothetical protein